MINNKLAAIKLNITTGLIFTLYCCLYASLLPGQVTGEVYDNTWVVRIKGGLAHAEAVARRHGMELRDQVFDDFYVFAHPKIMKRSLRPNLEHEGLLLMDEEILSIEQQVVKRRVKRDLHFNDEKWSNQWYLKRRNSNAQLLDMNVMSAWSQGYTGRGVVVTILDDGIERTHPDLVTNYDSRASKDVNGRDLDPTPRYEYTNENRHGTRCAGEVAASANNSVCGVGVAFQAKIGGIRMLDGDVTDSVEAMSLSYNRDHIDIYSVSWGPDDDGKTVDGPGSLARQAFRDGAVSGRRGKGSIFIWASGNGGKKDNCNCDGYTNSIYTLSISSASENGKVPWYSEACSSTLATTYSSGDTNERQIVTTDLRETCTDGHTGTSASAPIAAGIAALVLQANPGLTWRDMQYLVVMSSNPNNLQSNDWTVNGAGRRVSHHFGYGMMNAGKMVELAKNWTNVPPQKICEVAGPRKNQVIPSKETIIIKLTTNGCDGTSNHVVHLEHVQARISLSSAWRGDLNIWLTSPMGTRSTLLSRRPNDYSKVGFNEWAFMSTHMWGEYSQGEWTLEIENGYRALESANLVIWTLVLHGTEADPLEVAQFPNKDGSGAIRNIKSRDRAIPHSPYVNPSLIKSFAKHGIIIPDFHPSTPKPTPYVPANFVHPTYRPHDRPRFEYITDNINGQPSHRVKGYNKVPVRYNHGDHYHQIRFWKVVPSTIRPSSHTTSPTPPGGAATLRDFTLVVYGTEDDPVPNVKLPAPGEQPFTSRCPSTEVLYRRECVDACPHGWYSRFGVCFACHVTCASCLSGSNTSCTECFHSSMHVSGACIPIDDKDIIANTKGASSVQSPGLSSHSLWWLMVGATITVCLLVAFLVVLAIYYAYLQGYLCTSLKKSYGSTSDNTQSTSSSVTSTSGHQNLAPTPEQLRLTVSQNSSQLELVSDSEVSADEEIALRRAVIIRQGISVRV